MTSQCVAMQAGGVLGRRFQAHESHIPYLLQFKVSPASVSCCAATAHMPVQHAVASRASRPHVWCVCNSECF